MNHIKIPKFNPNNKVHKKLAFLSLEAHNKVKNGQPIEDIESEIDQTARRLWNIR